MTADRYVCTQNRTPSRCRMCGRDGLHVREELVARNGPPPECREHGVMVKEPK